MINGALEKKSVPQSTFHDMQYQFKVKIFSSSKKIRTNERNDSPCSTFSPPPLKQQKFKPWISYTEHTYTRQSKRKKPAPASSTSPTTSSCCEPSAYELQQATPTPPSSCESSPTPRGEAMNSNLSSSSDQLSETISLDKMLDSISDFNQIPTNFDLESLFQDANKDVEATAQVSNVCPTTATDTNVFLDENEINKLLEELSKELIPFPDDCLDGFNSA